jgi:fructan beta-fructosidase
MNDPNGLVYHDGTYHLFYQYNPQGADWGHLSWGHATSEDLVHWTPQPVAIPEEDGEMIFSGSVVVDPDNASGFGTDEEPPMVAVYTSHYTRRDGSFDQAQSLAYSVDGGRTWTKYEGNPVLNHPAPDFRDPNVFWYEPEKTWVMAVVLAKRHTVQFYASTDLVHWTHLSDFGPAGETGGVWECPALVRVPVEGAPDETHWVLKVDLNPGSVSGAQYFVGSFDGTVFVPDDSPPDDSPRWVDHGPDFYAAIPWNGVPETAASPLWIAWMSNWIYGDALPTSPWRGAHTLPRSVALRSVEGTPHLVQRPVEALRQLREDHVRVGSRTLHDETIGLAEAGVSGTTLELVAVFAVGDAQTVGLHVRAGDGERTVIGYDAAGAAFVDRTAASAVEVHDDFPVRSEAPLSPTDGRVTLRVFVDRSSVEVFANGGLRTLTHAIFPAPASDGVSVFAEGGPARLVHLDAWSLRSIWRHQY